jgi:hypothetical protein
MTKNDPLQTNRGEKGTRAAYRASASKAFCRNLCPQVSLGACASFLALLDPLSFDFALGEI